MECCPSLDWTLLVFDLLMVARSRAEGSNENLRYAQNRWVPEKWQIHTTQSLKINTVLFTWTRNRQRLKSESSGWLRLWHGTRRRAAGTRLGVVDRDIVYQFGRQVTKVWFYRQILGLFSWAGSPGPGRQIQLLPRATCSKFLDQSILLARTKLWVLIWLQCFYVTFAELVWHNCLSEIEESFYCLRNESNNMLNEYFITVLLSGE